MRALLLLTLTIFVTLVYLDSCSPIDPERWLINRPTREMMLRKIRSSVKGQGYGIKGVHPHTTEPSLTKGEYMCGNRICKLKPGDVPKNCHGVCQYPLHTISIYT